MEFRTGGMAVWSLERGAWPCGVCSEGVPVSLLQCTSCMKLVHSSCSGVKGSLRTASAGFMCQKRLHHR